MSDTMDTGLLPRTYFKAPRVPFDFRALGLTIAGYLVYWAGGLLISKILGKDDVPGAFLTAAYNIFQDLPYVGRTIGVLLSQVFHTDVSSLDLGDYTFWHVLVGGVWFFAVWSFVGQGVHRITALRIARDEGLTLAEGIKFSAKNWLTMLLVPLIVMGAIGFFYLCNMLAGAVISIPYVGQILGLILVPLAAISTLLILLIAVGGLFGLPLVGAAAAWERNGSLDAISRAFSYIFARPLQFFWNYFLIFMLLAIILLVGSWFITALTKSVDSGVWSDRLAVQIDPPDRQDREAFGDLSNGAQKDYDAMAGPDRTDWANGRDQDGSPFAKHFDAVLVAPWSHKLNVLVFWAAINLIWLGVFGYALYWFMGASTSVYADLRADVDGTEEDEIYLEEEEEEFDALADAAATATPPPESPETAETRLGVETVEPPAEAPEGEGQTGGSEAEGGEGESPPAED
ncbi:MAG: hypothetical protein ACYTG6_08705 [Planctomycetota bacterium]|jgi:hypothetical protein